jgi:hypothetical protein
MQCGSMRIKKSLRKTKKYKKSTRSSKGIKRDSGSRKRSKKQSKRSSNKRGSVKSKCRQWLQDKIKKNMKELKKGRWVSRAQAIAVSYSQVKKSHPQCKRSLAKKRTTKRK